MDSSKPREAVCKKCNKLTTDVFSFNWTTVCKACLLASGHKITMIDTKKGK